MLKNTAVFNHLIRFVFSFILIYFFIIASDVDCWFNTVFSLPFSIHLNFHSCLLATGFLQLVGCLGALRLSEKLLNAYWLLLLVLLIGDAVLGIFWMFKFDRIMHELQPMLRLVRYGIFPTENLLFIFLLCCKLQFIFSVDDTFFLAFFVVNLFSVNNSFPVGGLFSNKFRILHKIPHFQCKYSFCLALYSVLSCNSFA